MKELEQFKVNSYQDLEKRFSFPINSPNRIVVNREKVPSKFWILIPYMEYFALDDQDERVELMKQAPIEALKTLEAVMKLCDAPLDEWLAGPEAYAKEFSQEYIAASILREMAGIYDLYRPSSEID